MVLLRDSHERSKRVVGRLHEVGWLEQFLAKVDHVAKEESTALKAAPCRAGDDGIRHADAAALCNIDRQSEAALQQATQTASLASRHVLLEVRIAVA